MEDRETDAASGAWNPLTATGTPLSEARRLCDDALHGMRLALRDAEFTDSKLAHVLLVHELRRSVDRAFGSASCSHQPDLPTGSFGPAPGNPYAPTPGGPYGPPGPPLPPEPPRNRRGLIMRLPRVGGARLHLPDVLRKLPRPLVGAGTRRPLPEVRLR